MWDGHRSPSELWPWLCAVWVRRSDRAACGEVVRRSGGAARGEVGIRSGIAARGERIFLASRGASTHIISSRAHYSTYNIKARPLKPGPTC
jgi:hypothetical protein